MLDGQYSDSVRIVAFNTAKGWSRDVSAEIADEIAQRCAMDGFDVPPLWRGLLNGTATAGQGSCRCRSVAPREEI